ncbi:MAG: sodium-translocating pyrophosphatase [Candidatus Diapherotrites archaeon]|nr:sodium-translocating pyrophosphatase [Candidatus Diapherotrites archaeon]
MFELVFPLTVVCALALLSSYVFNWNVARHSSGNEKMRELQKHIREGAWTFMFEEARVFSVVTLAIAILLWFLFYWEVAFAFVLGAFLSMSAGFIGMHAATLANAKVTNAARSDVKKAFNIAISGGAVMGLVVAGLALTGLTIILVIFSSEFNPATLTIESKAIPFVSDILGRQINFIKAALIVSAYSMGASLVALFDRVGGGIYTKAADMAADLVGKAEEHLPEDDPRNPATIADNVGDNVGDVGGLGADLLESFVGSIISVIVIYLYMYVGRANPDINGLLAQIGVSNPSASHWWLLIAPLLIVAAGIIATLIALVYMVLTKQAKDMQKILMNGTRVSAIFTIIFASAIILFSPMNLNLFWCILLGVATGLIIGFVAEYYTSSKYKPVRKLAEETSAGAGIGIAGGMALGMLSTFVPGVVLALAIVLTYWLAGLIGIAYGALGMLSFVAMTVSVDTYGPIADNAGGIAQGAELPEKVRKVTDRLDAIGNTTAAIGKGFAIGSAAFSALALTVAYMWSAAGSAGEVVIPTIEILSSDARIGGAVIAALFLGAMIPYVFSALLIQAVSETAKKLVEEIKRQFKKFPGILKGTHKADYKKCIAITSQSALKKMVVPAIIALSMPFIIGFLLGKYALAGFLIGALLSCMQLAVYCANTGGALDNAKKYIEEGHYGGKGSEAHVASVIGDTVGDPLKDTVGPSLDILVKLMSVVSILFASLFPTYPIFF